LAELDIENLVEEIESLGRQERQELRNRLGVLLGHLLKWHYQPEARTKSWAATIQEQRRRIQRHLKENPSLKPYLASAIASATKMAWIWSTEKHPSIPNSCRKFAPFAEADIFEQPIDWPPPAKP
jgi:hypothetical protein